ncbi:unnamed protein product [Meganyctiphanes norvegica]|uniref:ABC transporter domain-containing protein n=1 Tax=Meganyctiphanes norvegica TaxID=48144 RepID=A0AAV2QVD9_MEGNR
MELRSLTVPELRSFDSSSVPRLAIVDLFVHRPLDTDRSGAPKSRGAVGSSVSNLHGETQRGSQQELKLKRRRVAGSTSVIKKKEDGEGVEESRLHVSQRVIKTVIEVVLPVVFCVLLVVIRDLAPSDEFPEPTYFQNFSIDLLPENLKPNENNGFLDSLTDMVLGDENSRRRRSINAEQIQQHILSGRKRFSIGDFIFGNSWWPIAYAPNNTAVKNVMEMVADDLWADADDMGFATERDMVKHLTTIAKNEDEGDSFFSGVEDVLGGIVFTNDFPDDKTFPKDIKYKIRLKGAPRAGSKRNPFAPPPQWLTEVSYPLFQVPGPRERNKNTGGRPGYYDEGFLSLQYAVDMALARYISGDETATRFSKIKLQRMPYPEYIDDKYLVALQAWMPFVLLASYIYPAINLVKSIVYEKEKKLKESMKMMGLPNWLHWLAWFIKSFMFLIVSTILITILLCTPWKMESSMQFFTQKNNACLLVFHYMYSIQTATCLLLLIIDIARISQANNASTATGLLWFFTYFPYMLLRPRYSSLTQGQKIILSLLSNTCMSLGCQLASMFEGTGAGIQWNNLFSGVSPDDQFTLAHVFGMLILDTLLFSILTWYLEAVRPGEFGVPKPWYFPVTVSYWCGSQSDTTAAEVAKFEHETATHDPDYFEPDPIGLVAGVKVQGLTKIFPRGKKVAVSKVFLDMYEGQITVLLGHNGAGKTTTMSMLTGLFPPTSGTAKVGGYDIVTEMSEVRQSLGLCPQHDVLFDQLTVSEHLYFFCRLKGMAQEDVNREVVEMVEKLKLSDKFDAQSKTLSGGMKRKLSVGIALCGSSRVVFLDEPTSGMDPGARRVIWDLLQQERSTRTILLTTHFMEEADLLGDRIAIMADGVIRCCGSSLFLKKKYGAGYRLITVKEKGCDVDAVTQLLKSHIPEAELDQNVGLELSYVLPNSNVSKFEELFTELEKRKEELKISSYGASQTTMDEVFLRVGEATNSEIMNRPKDATVIPPSSAENGHSLTPVETNELIAKHEPIEQIQLDSMNTNGVVSNGIGGSEVYPTSRRRTPLQRNSGCILILQQFWAMLVKKFLYTARNKILSLTQVLIPVAFLILALIVVNSIPGINDSPPQLPFRLSNFDGTYTPVQVINSNNNTQKLVDALSSSLTGKNKMEVVPSDKKMSTFILDNVSRIY